MTVSRLKSDFSVNITISAVGSPATPSLTLPLTLLVKRGAGGELKWVYQTGVGK